jgi:hypothetical protein
VAPVRAEEELFNPTEMNIISSRSKKGDLTPRRLINTKSISFVDLRPSQDGHKITKTSLDMF